MSQEEGQASEQPKTYENSVAEARAILDREDSPPVESIKDAPVIDPKEHQAEPEPEPAPVVEPEPEEKPLEIDFDAPIIEIEEVKEGGEKQVVKRSLNELKKERMMHADYTRKTQELANLRKQLPEEAKKMVEPQMKAAEHAIAVAHQLVMESVSPELVSMTPQKWAELSQNDPAQYVALRAKQELFASQLQAVTARQKQLLEHKEQQRISELTKSVQESVETIQREIPNWNQEVYGSILKTGSEFGFQPAELGQVADVSQLKPVYFTDARIVKAFHELGELRKKVAGLDAGKIALDKKVTVVPKVMKPGTSEKPDPKTENYEKAMGRLKKSGSTQDAVEAAKFLL